MARTKLFSKEHIWLEDVGDNIKLGISNYAQNKLGSIMFLNLPDIGEQLIAGEKFGDIESLKTVSELISPLNGSVIAVNDQLMDDPTYINSAPYDSWFIEVKLDSYSDNLMDENSYKVFLEAL